MKTRQQMEAAMYPAARNSTELTLLRAAWLSLPTTSAAYEMQLQEVIDSMIKFSSASDEMLTHQGKIRGNPSSSMNCWTNCARWRFESAAGAGLVHRRRRVRQEPGMLVRLTDSIRRDERWGART